MKGLENAEKTGKQCPSLKIPKAGTAITLIPGVARSKTQEATSTRRKDGVHSMVDSNLSNKTLDKIITLTISARQPTFRDHFLA